MRNNLFYLKSKKDLFQSYGDLKGVGDIDKQFQMPSNPRKRKAVRFRRQTDPNEIEEAGVYEEEAGEFENRFATEPRYEENQERAISYRELDEGFDSFRESYKSKSARERRNFSRKKKSNKKNKIRFVGRSGSYSCRSSRPGKNRSRSKKGRGMFSSKNFIFFF